MLKRFSLLLLLLTAVSAATCGNQVCEPGETAASCSDCCYRVSNQIYSPPSCATYTCGSADPDYCAAGSCVNGFACVANTKTYCDYQCSGGTCLLPGATSCSTYSDCSSGYCVGLPKKCSLGCDSAPFVPSKDPYSMCSAIFQTGFGGSPFNFASGVFKGYLVYDGDHVTVDFNLTGDPRLPQNFNLTASGPLGPFVKFYNGTQEITYVYYPSSPGPLSDMITVSLENVPTYIKPGPYNLTVVARFDVGGGTYRYITNTTSVVVLPSVVYEAGRDFPPAVAVGYSQRQVLMSGTPVNLEVWVW